MLVEEGLCESIEICFLIVGHTHASIDQYFSIISRAIRKAKFIGSVEALLELIKIAHLKSWKQPAIVREIKVYYNIIEAFSPYVNSDIHYYSVPHNFLITKSFGGLAITQYKLFSFNRYWLPPPPDDIDGIDSFEKAIVKSISIPQRLGVVNGFDDVLAEFNVHNNSSSGITSSSHKSVMEQVFEDNTSITDLENLILFKKMVPFLQNVCVESVFQQELRMEKESKGIQCE